MVGNIFDDDSWTFEPKMSKEEFEMLCEEVTQECASQLYESLTTYSSKTLMQFLLEETLCHKDGEKLSFALNDFPEYKNSQIKIMEKHVRIIFENQHRHTDEIEQTLRAQLENKQISKKEFTKLASKIFEDLNKPNNNKRLENGTKHPAELYNAILEILSCHKSFYKFQQATILNESHNQQFQLMLLKRVSIYLTKNSKRGKKINNTNELEALCHRVFEECGDRHIHRYPVLDLSGFDLKPSLYEKWLSHEIYKHSDTSRILRMIAGDGEKCCLFMSLLRQHAVLTMERQRRRYELSLIEPEVKVPVTEDCDPKELQEEEEKEEEEVDEKSEEDGLEESSQKFEELAENLKIEKEKVDKMEKCVEELRKEKKNLEKKLENSEKTIAENLKKEREHSRKLADDLKIEKENSRRIAENLELGRSKIEILEKENQNYEDSQKWFRSELEKFEKKASKENEKMKKLADDLKMEKENKRRIAEILELEREDARVLAENHKIEQEKVNKENKNLEEMLKTAEKTMAENLKKEISKKLADDLRMEKENSQRIAENLENMKKEIIIYEDSIKWFRSELEKAEQFIEIIKETQINEEKDKEQMARRISAMEEFQRINNKETEEWKELIMKMFEKQVEELRITKQELKKYRVENDETKAQTI